MREYIVPIYDGSPNHDEIFVGYIRDHATQIVRCGECKHYIYDGDRWVCKVLSNYYEPIVDLEEDGFCSRGERRTDG